MDDGAIITLLGDSFRCPRPHTETFHFHTLALAVVLVACYLLSKAYELPERLRVG